MLPARSLVPLCRNAGVLMEDASRGRPVWNWNEMLEAFRALGGAAENIAPQNGGFGRGLVAVNPAEPVLLRVPQNLLIPVDDIECTDGRFGLSESSAVPDSERLFFENYQETFSWGAGGKSQSAALVSGLNALPATVRELLTAEFGFAELLEGDFASRLQAWLLRSRAAPWRGGYVIAPVLELANRSAEGLRYERGKHLQIQGYVRNEILIRYGEEDACSIYCQFGIAERQPAAFSLPMRVRCEGGEIVLDRNLNDAVMRGRDRIPRATLDGRVLTLSFMMLGHRKVPRMARGSFRMLMREAGMVEADEVFDRIVRFNALKFIKLLRALEPYEGDWISNLRKIARYQLEAMSCSIGSREPSPATSRL